VISDVRTVSLSEQPIAVIRDRARRSELAAKIPDSCGKVWSFIQSRTDVTSNGRMIATYRGSDVNDLQIEVGAQVEAPFASDGVVASSSTPACTAAMVTIEAPYGDIHLAYDKLFAWCKQNNHTTGVCWELYHHPEPGPAQPKTDIFVELTS
jgi:effector-binding domain-containing protein